ncbi:CPBP family intramembrane glutamic endopeptidase [Clostridium tarantellae]|uniref:CPBP family intramembrane metalloprotease n=1 Tax=Clostridium tarantellae TaxID=39493 RepID=A0A6I1ML98_9CLOT|nr:CPBP family intramembrane glutamic endopeptidase [Clostridium tarantellae]MPQ42887.1 CPBP family intramembrane metalloprotease [Clostridium tarantellae]
MNFFYKFNIFKRLEYGNLSIGKISILGSILIIITNDLLYPFLTKITAHIVFKIMPPISYTIHNFFVFIIKFICAIVSLILIYYLIKFYNSLNSNKTTYTTIPSSNIFSSDLYYCTLLVIGFRLFYTGSISHITNLIPLPKFIEEGFRIMSTDYIYLFLSVCIFAPFIEEFMYRGIILNGFFKKYTPNISIILSSLIFAIVHFNIPQGINAFLLGLILGYVYLKTHSIYICIFMHFINNLCAQFIGLNNSSFSIIIFQSLLFTLLGISMILNCFSNLKLKYRT